MSKQLFDLGQIMITQGADEAFIKLSEAKNDPGEYLVRPNILLNKHKSGDWGIVDDEDHKTNDQAVIDGDRIVSSYILPETDEKIWVITEWDRSVTTILLPSEY
jgi:hypothetical protein